ncbi:hypothetical protein JoomaDRAFT_2573 [Galbibacter orientalis DSM 19592]|uniref:SsrA-binding protein n=2 Tax=Galbibacter TaxID=379068 RepID=I3C7F4_9FLAO|nr:hypothetical protein JoomaDRAFT_2573 [Galbibacter orientalis DSM 19592]
MITEQNPPQEINDYTPDNYLYIFYLYKKNNYMKKKFFKLLARINKLILPSFTKKELDLAKASKFQLAIIGWRAYVTKNALD